MFISSGSMSSSWKMYITSYVILFYVFMLVGLVGSQVLSLNLADSTQALYTVKDEDMTMMVEKLLLDCGLNMRDMKEVARSLDYTLLDETINDSEEMNMKPRLLYHLREIISFLFPATEPTFFSCLSKQHLPSLASGNENNLGSWYIHYLQSFLGWHTTSRRHLFDQSTPSIIRSLQSVSDTPAPAPLLSAGSGNPSFAPGTHIFSSPAFDESTPGSNSDLPSRKPNDSKTPIILAVIFSITGTSLLAALFFVFYKRRLRNHYLSYRQRDDRSFLSLSESDFSGSSPMSFGFRNSVEKMEPFSSKEELVQNGDITHVQAASVVAPTSNVSITSIFLKQQTVETSDSNDPIPPPPPVMAPPMQKASAAPAPPPPPPHLGPPMPKASLSPAPPPPAPPATTAASPAPPPPPPNKKPGAPPPPKAAIAPRPPQANLKPFRPPPLVPKQPEKATSSEDLGASGDSSIPRAKLKPFFWEKVAANPDHSMVWNQLKSGSFQFSEEMIEALFGYASANKPQKEGKEEVIKHATQAIRILDPKKSQNLAISLKALNVKIEEVCDALMEGNELPIELLQILLKMPPTSDEELRLRLYDGDTSQLGSAEQFLKALINIPSAYKRLDALLFMSILPEEVSGVEESLSTLEVACGELKNSRLFLKLLEAVLKTGNRMNNGTLRGGAQAFKLDTLLKLSDVKGADGKTTLLHFVVQEIIRSEGIRAFRATRQRSSSILSIKFNDSTDGSLEESEDYYRKLGLKVVSGLSDELENVKKAASIDADALTSTVATLGHRLLKLKEFLDTSVKNMEVDSGFLDSLKGFIEHTEANIVFVLEEERRIRLLVKKTIDFFHGSAVKNEGLRLFVIVRDFLGILDKACKEVRETPPPLRKDKENPKPQVGETSTKPTIPDPRQLIFPRIRDQRLDDSSSSSSDEES